MDSRRFLLALALSVGVIFVVQMLSKPTPPVSVRNHADSAAVASKTTTRPPGISALKQTNNSIAAPTEALPSIPATIPSTPVVPVETAIVASATHDGARYFMSSVGATPVSVVMNAYDNRSRNGSKVDLGTLGVPLLGYQIAGSNTTPIDLSAAHFAMVRTGDTITYQTTVGTATIVIRYAFTPDRYTARVSGTIRGIGTPSPYLLVSLPTTFPVTESDTSDDRNYLAYAYLSKHEGPHNVLFRSLDPGEKTLVTGPLMWIAAKSKYFVVGLLSPKGTPPLVEATLLGGARTSKVATTASATVVVPTSNGAFTFDLYTGPQSLRQLQAQGRDFDEVNPYGWAFLRGVMQPLAIGVTKIVLWMHERLALSYGMVLVLLGVLVRLILWPLNQSAMRSSLKMQELQPKLQTVQTRYKDDPEKQRVEMMKVYAEHGMNPLSPLMGCLPMLLPMPVLFALFFVFRNTIEFRGVSFLWLTDLSSKDPYYLLPIIMGASMYVLSWIGMRNAPPNPQAKIMSYMMPGMFVLFLARAASGLNLYYAVQNLAALPQQWLLTQERVRRAGKKP